VLASILVTALTNDTTQFDPDAKCPHNEVLYNVKLKAGLHAGKFTDIGKVRIIIEKYPNMNNINSITRSFCGCDDHKIISQHCATSQSDVLLRT
jgi:hypothetical protein